MSINRNGIVVEAEAAPLKIRHENIKTFFGLVKQSFEKYFKNYENAKRTRKRKEGCRYILTTLLVTVSCLYTL